MDKNFMSNENATAIFSEVGDRFRNIQRSMAIVEPYATTIRSYDPGDYLVADYQLYKVIASIPTNGTILEGTNVVKAKLADAFNSGGGGGGSTVKADWAETDSTADSYIRHKPFDVVDTSLFEIKQIIQSGVIVEQLTSPFSVDANGRLCISYETT